MKRISIIGLALMAVMAMSAIAASSAMANCELALGYCVLGKPLGAGQIQLIKATAESPFVLEGEVLGVKSIIKCTSLNLNAAEHPIIKGGMPGTGEKQRVEFTGCTSTLAGSSCTSTIVHNVTTLTEQVMILKPTTLAGRLATLFRPATGGVFSKILQSGCSGIIKEANAEVTGTTAALDEPTLVEALTGLLLYRKGANEITEVEKFGGAKEPVGLKFGGNTATLEGTAGVSLANDDLWGVF
jgi:hypothetical protein